MAKARAKNQRTNDKNSKQKSKLNKKSMWLIGAIAMSVFIVVLVIVIVLSNRSIELSAAYDKCKEEFAAAEAEIEELNSKRNVFRIYLKPNTPKETLISMAGVMDTLSEVKRVSVSTSEEEYENFLAENADGEVTNMLNDEMRALMVSKLPAIMQVEVYDVKNISSIKYVVENNPDFRKNIDDDREPTYNEKSPFISFGTLDLLDGGKTIIMEIENQEYTDKINCICSTLGMPDRIKDAIVHTTVADRTRRDKWGNYNIEWLRNNEKLHIVIYQK